MKLLRGLLAFMCFTLVVVCWRVTHDLREREVLKMSLGRCETKQASVVRPLAVSARAAPTGCGRAKVGWAVNTAAKRTCSTAVRKAASGTALSAGSGRTSRSASCARACRFAGASVPPT